MSGVEALVLDEADHMFDVGFLPDINRILAALPADRQNLLFSATMPKAIRALSEKVLRDPHIVELAHSAPAERIEHALYPFAEGNERTARPPAR
jgi:ATP-dependent RNA helicase RhlE